MLVFVLFWGAALAFGDYYLSNLMMSYTCLYSGQEEEKSVKRIFSNLFSMITNPSKSCGVVAMIFLRWILLLMLILGKHLVDPCDLVV